MSTLQTFVKSFVTMLIRQKGYRAFAYADFERPMSMTDPVAPFKPLAANPPAQPDGARRAALMENAKAFEATFVAQMLTHSGFSEALSSNGGFGGEAFSSLLVEQYAEKLVDQGGFGLAEKIYEQLLSKDGLNVERTNA
ncbi:MAG: rod-binding protein [Amphiplicatus sp.]